MKKFNFGIILLFSLLITSCTGTTLADVDTVTPTPQPIVVVPPPDETLVITAVGDIMMHDTQIRAGYNQGTGTYDYSPFFTLVQPLLSASDLTLGNLETPLAGKKAGYSGYPRFNAPEILASNLKDAGFDVLFTANNHCMDKGEKGLFSTLDYLDNFGLSHAGTSRTLEERDKILIIEKKGLKIALLAYTFSTNGIRPSNKNSYVINYLDPEEIKRDILRARKEGARLVIISLHNGVEYQPYPNPQQKQLVQELFETGADIILGHHPHVLQPMELFTNDDPGQLTKKFVIHSLGNFISHQRGLERLSSTILNINIGIDSMSKEPYFKDASYIPIWTRVYRNNGKRSFQIVPVEPALTTINTGRSHDFSPKEIADLKKSWDHITNHLNTSESAIMLQKLSFPLEGLTLLETYQ